MESIDLSATLLAFAVAFWFLQSLYSLFAGKSLDHAISSRIFLLPCLFLLASSLLGFSGEHNFRPGRFFCFGTELIFQRIDGLSSVFMLLLAVVGTACALFSPVYLEHMKDRLHSGHYWSSLSFFMLSMTLVLSSANALSFLVFWELMSLSSLCLVASEHKHRRVQDAGFIYLASTRIASAFLAIGFLYMYSICHSFNFSDWHLRESEALLPAIFIFLGFAIKAGIWPFHIWLPYAHPAAPAPVSALMSGVMVKIALYAIVRILIRQDLCPMILGHICLAFGLISSFWGILFALVQHDLKRLLAYSTVENLGLVFVGIGLSIVAEHRYLPVAVLALSAALFHAFNHGVFKSLLFLAAGSVDALAKTRDLFHLGGLAAKMPFTMSFFIFAAASICALPPLAGFASKYLLYQGLLQFSFQSQSLLERALVFLSVGVLALVGALAIACFAKASAVTFLAKARSRSLAEQAKESSAGMITAMSLLSVISLGSGIFAIYLSPALEKLAARILSIEQPLKTAAFGIPVGFSFAAALLFCALFVLFLNTSKRRRYDTWDCGFGKLSARSQASSVSLVQPLAYIFSPILRFKLLVEITGRDRRNFPEHIKVEPQMRSLLIDNVYMPAIALLQNFSKGLAKLQAGSIHLYLLYVCATLIVLVLIGMKL